METVENAVLRLTPDKKPDPRFAKNRNQRAHYWSGIYSAERLHSNYTKFQARYREFREFMEKDIEAILVREGVTLGVHAYWYKGSFVNKVFDYATGRLFSDRWRVRFKEDTVFGGQETAAMSEAADILEDDLNSDEVQSVMEECLLDMVGGGWCGVINRVLNRQIDMRTGKLKVVTERADPELTLWDQQAYGGNNCRYKFYGQRLPLETIRGLYPGVKDLRPGSWMGEEFSKSSDEQSGELVQVEFWRYEQRRLFEIDPRLADYFGVSTILSEEEFDLLTARAAIAEQTSSGVGRVLVKWMQDTVVEFSEEPRWYYDVFCGDQSLLERPLPVWANGNTVGVEGWNMLDARLKNRRKDANPQGMIFELRDEILLAILSLTVLVRQIIQLEGDWTIINRAAFANADEVIATMKSGSGIVEAVMNDDFDNDLRKHIHRARREDEVALQILQIVGFMLNRLEETGQSTPEATGKSVFAGAAASLQGMLQMRSALMNVGTDRKFIRMVNRTVRHKAWIFQQLGIIDRDVPLQRLESMIDTRSVEEKDADAIRIQKDIEAGLATPEMYWVEKGWNAETMKLRMQGAADAELGNMIRSQRPDIMLALQGGKQDAGVRG